MAAERTARRYLGAAPMTRLFHLSNLNQRVIVRKRERVISVSVITINRYDENDCAEKLSTEK